METQYWLLLIIVAVVLTLIIRIKREDAAAMTLSETWFANVSEPQFYEQRDPTVEAAQSARAEWETAVKMLRECGNQFIRESDLHLLLWRASDNDERVEFSAWRALALQIRREKMERFIAEKTKNLKGDPAAMADVVWKNDTYNDTRASN